MRFHTRKWVKPEDLNANGTLFGGRVLAWVDEEAALYSIIQLENKKVVTKYISEINFITKKKKIINLVPVYPKLVAVYPKSEQVYLL